MRKTLILLLVAAISQVAQAQTSFEQLLERISWNTTESSFVNEWKNSIEKTEPFENSGYGGFRHEYVLEGIQLVDSALTFYVNVNPKDKVLKFLSAVLPETKELRTQYNNFKSLLTEVLGEPNIVSNGYFIDCTWLLMNNKVNLSEGISSNSIDIFPNKTVVKESSPIHKRFQLFPTENMWTFLELDTVYGLLSKVQYGVNDSGGRLKKNITFDDLREGSIVRADELIPGRFELHKTQNIYNFILLDTVDGRTWQVQWSINGDNDLILPIKQ